jgi:hypothetical protein
MSAISGEVKQQLKDICRRTLYMIVCLTRIFCFNSYPSDSGDELLSVDSNSKAMTHRHALSLRPLAFFACLLTPEINST